MGQIWGYPLYDEDNEKLKLSVSGTSLIFKDQAKSGVHAVTNGRISFLLEKDIPVKYGLKKSDGDCLVLKVGITAIELQKSKKPNNIPIVGKVIYQHVNIKSLKKVVLNILKAKSRKELKNEAIRLGLNTSSQNLEKEILNKAFLDIKSKNSIYVSVGDKLWDTVSPRSFIIQYLDLNDKPINSLLFLDNIYSIEFIPHNPIHNKISKCAKNIKPKIDLHLNIILKNAPKIILGNSVKVTIYETKGGENRIYTPKSHHEIVNNKVSATGSIIPKKAPVLGISNLPKCINGNIYFPTQNCLKFSNKLSSYKHFELVPGFNIGTVEKPESLTIDFRMLRFEFLYSKNHQIQKIKGGYFLLSLSYPGNQTITIKHYVHSSQDTILYVMASKNLKYRLISYCFGDNKSVPFIDENWEKLNRDRYIVKSLDSSKYAFYTSLKVNQNGKLLTILKGADIEVYKSGANGFSQQSIQRIESNSIIKSDSSGTVTLTNVLKNTTGILPVSLGFKVCLTKLKSKNIVFLEDWYSWRYVDKMRQIPGIIKTTQIAKTFKNIEEPYLFNLQVSYFQFIFQTKLTLSNKQTVIALANFNVDLVLLKLKNGKKIEEIRSIGKTDSSGQISIAFTGHTSLTKDVEGFYLKLRNKEIKISDKFSISVKDVSSLKIWDIFHTHRGYILKHQIENPPVTPYKFIIPTTSIYTMFVIYTEGVYKPLSHVGIYLWAENKAGTKKIRVKDDIVTDKDGVANFHLTGFHEGGSLSKYNIYFEVLTSGKSLYGNSFSANWITKGWPAGTCEKAKQIQIKYLKNYPLFEVTDKNYGNELIPLVFQVGLKVETRLFFKDRNRGQGQLSPLPPGINIKAYSVNRDLNLGEFTTLADPPGGIRGVVIGANPNETIKFRPKEEIPTFSGYKHVKHNDQPSFLHKLEYTDKLNPLKSCNPIYFMALNLAITNETGISNQQSLEFDATNKLFFQDNIWGNAYVFYNLKTVYEVNSFAQLITNGGWKGPHESVYNSNKYYLCLRTSGSDIRFTPSYLHEIRLIVLSHKWDRNGLAHEYGHHIQLITSDISSFLVTNYGSKNYRSSYYSHSSFKTNQFTAFSEGFAVFFSLLFSYVKAFSDFHPESGVMYLKNKMAKITYFHKEKNLGQKVELAFAKMLYEITIKAIYSHYRIKSYSPTIYDSEHFDVTKNNGSFVGNQSFIENNDVRKLLQKYIWNALTSMKNLKNKTNTPPGTLNTQRPPKVDDYVKYAIDNGFYNEVKDIMHKWNIGKK